MLLEVFAQERLVGEVQLVGYLLDVLGRVLQQHTHFQNDIVVNPVSGCTLRYLLDDFREILGGDAQLFGIPADAAFVAEVQFQEADELRKEGVGAGLYFR